jgi:tetratricopeptide (TPR) repeat protein
VKPLAHPDSFHLRAARGWLELGNPLEANEELEKIAPALGMHPDVLEVRWQISAKARQWEACIELAERIIALTPDNPFGWIHRSFALHELKRTQEAWDNLIRVIKKFPKEAIIPYNLSCYACQLGNLQDALNWLRRAFAVGDGSKVKLMALADPDLEPLWDKIAQIQL